MNIDVENKKMIEQFTNQIEDAKQEAKLLKEYAAHLEKASASENNEYRYLVLDENMKMWVEIDSYLKNKNNLLPQDIKNNLDKLSKYVEMVTLYQGVNMNKDTFKTLANINNQIAEGLMESVTTSLAQQESYYLAKSGLNLVEAMNKKDNELIINALDNNQKIWIMIKVLMQKNRSNLPQDVKDNLIKLADYVVFNTSKLTKDLNNLDKKILNSFVDINKHISEGLIGHR